MFSKKSNFETLARHTTDNWNSFSCLQSTPWNSTESAFLLSVNGRPLKKSFFAYVSCTDNFCSHSKHKSFSYAPFCRYLDLPSGWSEMLWKRCFSSYIASYMNSGMMCESHKSDSVWQSAQFMSNAKGKQRRSPLGRRVPILAMKMAKPWPVLASA